MMVIFYIQFSRLMICALLEKVKINYGRYVSSRDSVLRYERVNSPFGFKAITNDLLNSPSDG